MEEYGKILVIVMPVFLLLIVIEKIYGHYKGNDAAPLMDTVSSVSSGMTNSVKDVLGISISLISYGWLVSKIAVFHLEANVIGHTDCHIKLIFYGTSTLFTTVVRNSIWLVPCANLFLVL